MNGEHWRPAGAGLAREAAVFDARQRPRRRHRMRRREPSASCQGLCSNGRCARRARGSRRRDAIVLLADQFVDGELRAALGATQFAQADQGIAAFRTMHINQALGIDNRSAPSKPVQGRQPQQDRQRPCEQAPGGKEHVRAVRNELVNHNGDWDRDGCESDRADNGADRHSVTPDGPPKARQAAQPGTGSEGQRDGASSIRDVEARLAGPVGPSTKQRRIDPHTRHGTCGEEQADQQADGDARGGARRPVAEAASHRP